MLIKKDSNDKTANPAATTSRPASPEIKKEFSPATSGSSKANVTRVLVKYDVGFGNQLFIRGNGANLSWDKGIPLNNISSDEWVWETTAPFKTCEFKILLNDFQYEVGENHRMAPGATVQYSPIFFS